MNHNIPINYLEHALHSLLINGRIIMENGKCIGRRRIVSTVIPEAWPVTKQVIDYATDEFTFQKGYQQPRSTSQPHEDDHEVSGCVASA